jgi:hypothetical protein
MVHLATPSPKGSSMVWTVVGLEVVVVAAEAEAEAVVEVDMMGWRVEVDSAR